MTLLEHLWQEMGLTMVIVTHDSSVARRAQQIGVVKEGRLNVEFGARPAGRDVTPARPARSGSRALRLQRSLSQCGTAFRQPCWRFPAYFTRRRPL